MICALCVGLFYDINISWEMYQSNRKNITKFKENRIYSTCIFNLRMTLIFKVGRDLSGRYSEYLKPLNNHSQYYS